jgi:hypothetical protein
MPNDQAFYTVDHSTMPPSCLPTHLDRSNLHDVTRLGDSWRRYFDASTGDTHDGSRYAAAMRAEMRGGSYGCNPLGKCAMPQCPDCPDMGLPE